jgi:hypothetical protein
VESPSTLPIREATDAELVEAMERVDAVVRLADPRFAEAVGIGQMERLPIDDAPVTFVTEPEPEVVDEALIGRVAAKVSEWRDDLAHELHHLDKNAPRRIYREALSTIAQHDAFLDAVRDYQKDAV